MKNKTFKNGDRVIWDVEGGGETIVKGTIIGLISEHIINLYIVLMDTQLRNYPWQAACAPASNLKYELDSLNPKE